MVEACSILIKSRWINQHSLQHCTIIGWSAEGLQEGQEVNHGFPGPVQPTGPLLRSRLANEGVTQRTQGSQLQPDSSERGRKIWSRKILQPFLCHNWHYNLVHDDLYIFSHLMFRLSSEEKKWTIWKMVDNSSFIPKISLILAYYPLVY